MNKQFLKWLKKQKIVLTGEQLLLASVIFMIFDNRPSFLAARTGKTFILRKIDEFLDTQPQFDAQTICSSKRKA